MINDENQEKNPGHEAFMPKDNNESNVSPEMNDLAIESSEEIKTGYGFERSNEDLIWVAQKVNQVRQEMSKFVTRTSQISCSRPAGTNESECDALCV